MYSHACLLPDSNAVAVGPLVISEANYFSLQPKRMEKEIVSQGIICFHLDPVFLSAHITVLPLCLRVCWKWAHLGWFGFFSCFHPRNVTWLLKYVCGQVLMAVHLFVGEAEEWRSWSVVWGPAKSLCWKKIVVLIENCGNLCSTSRFLLNMGVSTTSSFLEKELLETGGKALPLPFGLISSFLPQRTSM